MPLYPVYCGHCGEDEVIAPVDKRDYLMCPTCYGPALRGPSSFVASLVDVDHYSHQLLSNSQRRAGKGFSTRADIDRHFREQGRVMLDPAGPEVRAWKERTLDEAHDEGKACRNEIELADHRNGRDVKAETGWSDTQYVKWRDMTNKVLANPGVSHAPKP